MLKLMLDRDSIFDDPNLSCDNSVPIGPNDKCDAWCALHSVKYGNGN